MPSWLFLEISPGSRAPSPGSHPTRAAADEVHWSFIKKHLRASIRSVCNGFMYSAMELDYLEVFEQNFKYIGA